MANPPTAPPILANVPKNPTLHPFRFGHQLARLDGLVQRVNVFGNWCGRARLRALVRVPAVHTALQLVESGLKVRNFVF